MFRNPSGEEHSISVVLHCCSGSSLIKVREKEEETQMAIVYFAIFRFLHPFWFLPSLSVFRKTWNKGRTYNFSALYLQCCWLFRFCFISFRHRRDRNELCSAFSKSDSSLFMIKHSQCSRKQRRRGAAQSSSSSLYRWLIVSQRRNGIEDGWRTLVSDRHHPTETGGARNEFHDKQNTFSWWIICFALITIIKQC